MAQNVAIAGGPEIAKIRSVFAPALLPMITLGIYFFVWYFRINRELAALGRKNGRDDLGTSPGLSLVAVLVGWILIIPPVLSVIGTYKRMKRAQQLMGVPEQQQANPWIFGLCYAFIGPVGIGYLQNELNKVWQLQGEPGQTTPVAPSAGPNFMKG